MTRPELVFVGQIAPDAAAFGEPVARQAKSALSHLERALAERRLVLEDLLRLRLFVTNLDDLPAIERAMDSFGGAEWPAVSVVELPGSDSGVALTLDAVAAPGARERRRVVRLSEPYGSEEARPELGGPPRSVRLGPWVFVGATATSAGRAPSSSPSDRPDVADPTTRRIGEESRAVFARIAELLRAQGAELRDVVKVGGWLTFPMRDYGPLAEVRETLLDRTGLMPASAGVQVERVGTGEELLAFEAIAFAPRDGAERGHGGETTSAPSRLARFYADAHAAGGYVFTSGEVPDGRGSVQAQAREVYGRLRSHLAAHDASPADVVHQTVFVRRAGEENVIAEAAREFCDADTLPPTTLLSVADIGFRPGCDIEIELVAAADEPSADAR